MTCKLSHGTAAGEWFFTGLYASCEDSTRARQWSYLQNLQSHLGDRWIILGDFNAILHPHEKRGGNHREGWLLLNLKDFFHKCRLMDMGYKGFLPYEPRRWENSYDWY